MLGVLNQTRGLPKAFLLMATLVTGGCASSGSLVRQPAVELASVEVTDMDFAKQTFLLGFTVYNPNPFPLPVQGVRYKVRLNDQNFAGGETAGRFTIPADGNGNFAISVDLDLMRSGAQLTSLLRSGLKDDLRYELHGDLDIDIPMTPSLRFSSSGTIAVQAARR
jgi:LEA14-like dessication related protein